MVKWPYFVEHAFSAINIIGMDEEEIHAFSSRWGGLTLLDFARALHEGDPKDQQIAAYALGAVPSRWSRDLLLPYLHHKHPKVRWAVAEALGHVHEEEAFPVLLEILQEFLPPQTLEHDDWYDVHHIFVAGMVGSWGKQEAIPVLQEVLARLWQAEQEPATQDAQLWWHYQDAVVAALGNIGAFYAIAYIEASRSRKMFWAVTLILGYLGYLEKVGMPQVTILNLLNDARKRDAGTERLALLPDLLQNRMGFTASEAMAFAETYEQECFARLEPDAFPLIG